MRILYNSKKAEYKTPFGAIRQGEECTISVKVPVSCHVMSAEIRLKEDITNTEKTVGLTLSHNDELYEYNTNQF